ncbi:hypothetical protein PPYR_02181 [Photinus pyralis]|uniref:Uncharacterized protein n=3 Tax=Photinus pyralis TaxID=7054 RepID=A0A5N4B6G8_PHOPY|nr:hypothetical protein PPYR_02181 [Photinus pyralis]
MHTPLQISEQHQMAVTVDIHQPPASKRRKTAAIEQISREELILPPPIPDLPAIDVLPVAESTRITSGLDQSIVPMLEKRLSSQPILEEQHISLAPRDVTVETELPPAAEAPRQKPMIAVVDPEMQLKRNRLKCLRRNLEKWDFENQGNPTIEDVCKRPINRLNIATAFNDLLTLHKMEYVILTSKPDSLELGEIQMGQKLQ